MARNTLHILVCTLALSLVSGTLSASVLNPSFETGDLTHWTVTGTPFTVHGASPSPTDGLFFAQLQFNAEPGGGGTGQIKQTFTVPADQDTISVDMGWVGVPGQRSATLYCPSTTQTFDLFLGVEIDLPGPWKRYSTDISSASGLQVELTFLAMGTETNGMNFWVDNIQLSRNIPEPAGLTLILFGGLAIIRRRK